MDGPLEPSNNAGPRSQECIEKQILVNGYLGRANPGTSEGWFTKSKPPGVFPRRRRLHSLEINTFKDGAQEYVLRVNEENDLAADALELANLNNVAMWPMCGSDILLELNQPFGVRSMISIDLQADDQKEAIRWLSGFQQILRLVRALQAPGPTPTPSIPAIGTPVIRNHGHGGVPDNPMIRNLAASSHAVTGVPENQMLRNCTPSTPTLSENPLQPMLHKLAGTPQPTTASAVPENPLQPMLRNLAGAPPPSTASAAPESAVGRNKTGSSQIAPAVLDSNSTFITPSVPAPNLQSHPTIFPTPFSHPSVIKRSMSVGHGSAQMGGSGLMGSGQGLDPNATVLPSTLGVHPTILPGNNRGAPPVNVGTLLQHSGLKAPHAYGMQNQYTQQHGTLPPGTQPSIQSAGPQQVPLRIVSANLPGRAFHKPQLHVGGTFNQNSTSHLPPPQGSFPSQSPGALPVQPSNDFSFGGSTSRPSSPPKKFHDPAPPAVLSPRGGNRSLLNQSINGRNRLMPSCSMNSLQNQSLTLLPDFHYSFGGRAAQSPCSMALREQVPLTGRRRPPENSFAFSSPNAELDISHNGTISKTQDEKRDDSNNPTTDLDRRISSERILEKHKLSDFDDTFGARPPSIHEPEAEDQQYRPAPLDANLIEESHGKIPQKESDVNTGKESHAQGLDDSIPDEPHIVEWHRTMDSNIICPLTTNPHRVESNQVQDQISSTNNSIQLQESPGSQPSNKNMCNDSIPASSPNIPASLLSFPYSASKPSSSPEIAASLYSHYDTYNESVPCSPSAHPSHRDIREESVLSHSPTLIDQIVDPRLKESNLLQEDTFPIGNSVRLDLNHLKFFSDKYEQLTDNDTPLPSARLPDEVVHKRSESPLQCAPNTGSSAEPAGFKERKLSKSSCREETPTEKKPTSSLPLFPIDSFEDVKIQGAETVLSIPLHCVGAVTARGPPRQSVEPSRHFPMTARGPGEVRGCETVGGACSSKGPAVSISLANIEGTKVRLGDMNRYGIVEGLDLSTGKYKVRIEGTPAVIQLAGDLLRPLEWEEGSSLPKYEHSSSKDSNSCLSIKKKLPASSPLISASTSVPSTQQTDEVRPTPPISRGPGSAVGSARPLSAVGSCRGFVPRDTNRDDLSNSRRAASEIKVPDRMVDKAFDQRSFLNDVFQRDEQPHTMDDVGEPEVEWELQDLRSQLEQHKAQKRTPVHSPNASVISSYQPSVKSFQKSFTPNNQWETFASQSESGEVEPGDSASNFGGAQFASFPPGGSKVSARSHRSHRSRTKRNGLQSVTLFEQREFQTFSTGMDNPWAALDQVSDNKKDDFSIGFEGLDAWSNAGSATLSPPIKASQINGHGIDRAPCKKNDLLSESLIDLGNEIPNKGCLSQSGSLLDLSNDIKKGADNGKINGGSNVIFSPRSGSLMDTPIETRKGGSDVGFVSLSGSPSENNIDLRGKGGSDVGFVPLSGSPSENNIDLRRKGGSDIGYNVPSANSEMESRRRGGSDIGYSTLSSVGSESGRQQNTSRDTRLPDAHEDSGKEAPQEKEVAMDDFSQIRTSRPATLSAFDHFSKKPGSTIPLVPPEDDGSVFKNKRDIVGRLAVEQGRKVPFSDIAPIASTPPASTNSNRMGIFGLGTDRAPDGRNDRPSTDRRREHRYPFARGVLDSLPEETPIGGTSPVIRDPSAVKEDQSIFDSMRHTTPGSFYTEKR